MNSLASKSGGVTTSKVASRERLRFTSKLASFRPVYPQRSVIALRLGCGEKVPAWTVMRNCASGLQAIDSAYVNIIAGRSSLVLAGGTDAMSHAPVLFGAKMVNWLGAWYAAKTIFTESSLR